MTAEIRLALPFGYLLHEQLAEAVWQFAQQSYIDVAFYTPTIVLKLPTMDHFHNQGNLAIPKRKEPKICARNTINFGD